MISYQQPIVSFGKALINLAHVDYVHVEKDATRTDIWKMTVQFDKGTSLTWRYDTEADAYAALGRFQAMNESFVINEFP